MRLTCFGFLSAVVYATQYAELANVLSLSPVRNLRLTEIQSVVQAEGPMKQIEGLCLTEQRMVNQEKQAATFEFNSRMGTCETELDTLVQSIQEKSGDISEKQGEAVKYATKWNEANTQIADDVETRDKLWSDVEEHKQNIVKLNAERKQTKQIYDQNMKDFGLALKDIDELKKIINNNTNLASTQTSTNAAGFLEVVDNVKSDRIRQMTYRLTHAASFLEQDAKEVSESHAAVPPISGTDKIMNLLMKIRNELWREMDKLTQTEQASIEIHRNNLIAQITEVQTLEKKRADIYIKIGKALEDDVGQNMINEADARLDSADATKLMDGFIIDKAFLDEECALLKPSFDRRMAVLQQESETLGKMIEILQGLDTKWSSNVFKSIAHIGDGVTNVYPEPGYIMGYQLDLRSGRALTKGLEHTYTGTGMVDFQRVAIQLTMGKYWTWVSFEYAYDENDDNSRTLLLPSMTNGVFQDGLVKKMHYTSSHSSEGLVEEAYGNFEIGAAVYDMVAPEELKKMIKKQGTNQKFLPSDGQFDWGDTFQNTGDELYGCFQVHSFMTQQSLIAVNNIFSAKGFDVGSLKPKVADSEMGEDAKVIQPDYTGAGNSEDIEGPITLSWYYMPNSSEEKGPTKIPPPPVTGGATPGPKKTAPVEKK